MMKTPRRINPILAVAACSALLLSCSQSHATRNGDAPEPGAADPVVAVVEGQQIKMSQVDKKAIPLAIAQYEEVYNARLGALRQLIADQLFEKEAKKRGTTVEKLVEAEINSKVESVTDADVEAWYQQNQARLRGRPLDQIRDQVKQFLGQERYQEAWNAFYEQLKQGSSVSMRLQPPRVPIEHDASAPAQGPDTAAVKIVEWSEFP